MDSKGNAARKEAPGGGLTALDDVGVACARAACVALIVGFVEGTVVGARVGEGGAGLALATAGLWFPGALVALLPGHALVRVANDRRRRTLVAAVLGGACALSAILAWVAPISAWSVLPLETFGAIAAAWGASLVRLDGPIRRPAAWVGIALAAMVQLYANRWVDVHRALAGALVDHTFVPRIMLRFVLRRFA